MITFVRETQGLDFVGRDRVARRPLPHPARVRGRVARARTRAAAAASRLLRSCSTRRPTFYERYLWDSQAGSFARDYLAGRGLGEEVCREFRLGLALGGNDARAQGAREGLHRARSCAPPGSRASAAATTSSAGCCSRSPTRAAACVGFQARRLHEDDPLRAKYVNTPESELFTKGAVRLRARQGARGDRARGPRLRRRGEHRRDRAAAGRLRAGRRVHGHGAHRAAAARARRG